MKTNPRIPYLSPKEIERRASSFLDKYCPDRDLPIPIEEIIELKMGIKIFPVPNLRKDFSVDSYISSDFSQICIDKRCYEREENRCRFTYAHEIAHLILHREFYQSVMIQDVQSYLIFQNTLTHQEIKRLEIQAHLFAGFILLPNTQFLQTISKLTKSFGDIEAITVSDMGMIIRALASKLKVSEQVIIKQIEICNPELIKQVYKFL